jgi:hypothetical protein
VEVRKTDTVFVEFTDTLYLTKSEIKQEIIRDTVIIDYKPQIRAFRTSKPFLYGNTYVTGEVLGEVLNMSISNDFKIPSVTNTISRTENITNTIAPKGLFLGAGVTNQLKPLAKIDYLNKDFIFTYGYTFENQSHFIGVSKKLF